MSSIVNLPEEAKAPSEQSAKKPAESIAIPESKSAVPGLPLAAPPPPLAIPASVPVANTPKLPADASDKLGAKATKSTTTTTTTTTTGTWTTRNIARITDKKNEIRTRGGTGTTTRFFGWLVLKSTGDGDRRCTWIHEWYRNEDGFIYGC